MTNQPVTDVSESWPGMYRQPPSFLSCTLTAYSMARSAGPRYCESWVMPYNSQSAIVAWAWAYSSSLRDDIVPLNWPSLRCILSSAVQPRGHVLCVLAVAVRVAMSLKGQQRHGGGRHRVFAVREPSE